MKMKWKSFRHGTMVKPIQKPDRICEPQATVPFASAFANKRQTVVCVRVTRVNLFLSCWLLRQAAITSLPPHHHPQQHLSHESLQ